jgi:hypothetical protein
LGLQTDAFGSILPTVWIHSLVTRFVSWYRVLR